MAEPHVFREVCLGAVEAGELVAIASTLETIGAAAEDARWLEWASLLRLLHRRFERQEPIEIGPGVHVTVTHAPVDVEMVSGSQIVSLGSRRPVLQLIPGGAA